MDKRISTTAEALDRALPLLKQKGEATLERFADWAKPASLPKTGERGGGLADSTPEDRVSERREDRKAAGYHAEYVALLARMEADARRMAFLVAEAHQPRPRQIQGKDMLSAQIAAGGWCISCFRNDQRLEPIALRTSGPNAGSPYYRDLCRFCGGWKAEYGSIPDLETLRRHHDGHRIQRRAG